MIDFECGCNYWASHAGMFMWRQWRAEVVEDDFRRLAALGLTRLRIFPLWPDFQPLTRIYGGGSRRCRMAWRDDEALPPDGTTVDPVMLERLEFVCDCASRHGFKLIVALVTGWMSGRMFAPPAFQECNLITDPECLFYETQMIREIVTALRRHPAVEMWEPGNECNCMERVNRDQARAWLRAITDAIRAADPTRPVCAGMHGLLGARHDDDDPSRANWRIGDAGQCCDVLSTHPYPLFTPHVGTDPVDSFKSLHHAVCEGQFYADLSGKPCIPEEVGTLSNTVASRQQAGDYLDGVLKNLAIHGVHSLYWWCAFDQAHLTRQPYTVCAVERELGLFQADGAPKPVAEAMMGFLRLCRELPALPPMRRDAVVLLANAEESWTCAYGAFLLARQAHFDVEFRFCGQELPQRQLYIVPSLTSQGEVDYPIQQELVARAEAGATVLFTTYDALFAPYDGLFGIESQGVETAPAAVKVDFGGALLPFSLRRRYLFQPREAEVLARDEAGQPVFTRRRAGQGWLYFLALPLEMQVAQTAGALKLPYHRFYSAVAPQRPFTVAASEVGVSIHEGDGVTYAVCINNGTAAMELSPILAPGVTARLVAGADTLPPRGIAVYDISCGCP